MKRKFLSVILITVLALSVFGGCVSETPDDLTSTTTEAEIGTKDNESSGVFTLASIPQYSGSPYVSLNGNEPEFSSDDYTIKGFEKYSDLDDLGRCGTAYACVGIETMPAEERGSIGQVKPSGWVTAKYDFVDGKYLYNRCHLIGFQLTGENANERNLITGTRYMNVEGMLPFENMIADYVKETENHVLYRVTPVFDGNNLVVSGVQMEAWSVEDNGEGICFNVYCYNVQPGVVIDYATGESRAEVETATNSNDNANSSQYVLNTSSKKIHNPTCSSIEKISENNKKTVSGKDLKSYLDDGYGYCKNCFK